VQKKETHRSKYIVWCFHIVPWPISTAFLGFTVLFVESGLSHSLAFHCRISCVIFGQNVEESWTCQEIYDVGKVNLKAKWPGSVEKHKFDTKCTEIN
jgi:hypothetical protein